MPTPISSSQPAQAPAPADNKKLKSSAQQFEALLLAQMLRSMRESGSGGWLGTGEDSTAASAMEMAEEQFAQAMSAQGGLGLATMVTRGLSETGE